MPKYYVEVICMQEPTFVIEAETEDEAIERVEDELAGEIYTINATRVEDED